ncbi:hypothetical protein ACFSSA_07895 [Luteolibacter algae]|uniref:Uncharacterized protein n=1 Tax=Luteolibacter algae TaxID=454151 RepID=A0ABW5D871_9BACT
MKKNLSSGAATAFSIAAIMIIPDLNAAITLNGDHTVSPSGGEAGNLTISGDLSIVKGIDLGIAVDSSVAGVLQNYFGVGSKIFATDISDAAGSFGWRDGASSAVRYKMKLGASNSLSLFHPTTFETAILLDPSAGRLDFNGAFSGIYANGQSILTLGNGSVGFGNAPLRLASNVSSSSSGSGAFTVSGGIGVGMDSYFNGIRIGRGSGSDASNTIIGNNSFSSNSTGKHNTGIGIGTLRDNVSGSGNTATGAYTLQQTNTGSFNTGYGQSVLQHNTAGAKNTGIGWKSLISNITGNENVALGVSSLSLNQEGNSNTAVGAGSLEYLKGDGNLAIGQNAGRYQADGIKGFWRGSNMVFIGSGTRSKMNWESNAIVIGTGAISDGSNTTVIGNDQTISTRLRGESTTDSLKVIGETVLSGGAVISGQVTLAQPQGDISMGIYE